MKVIDRWTTQHGTWDVKASNRWGIDQAHRDKYLAGRDIPGSGGDRHIFVKVKPGQAVQFTSDGGKTTKQYIADSTGWVNHPMAGGSAYYPDEGKVGPWTVAVYMEVVANGIGLPNGEHVSTFLVIGDDDETEPETGTGPTPPQYDKIALVVNGITVWQN